MNCNCNNNSIETKQEIIDKADSIINQIGTSRQAIIPLLQALQDEFSYLSSDVLERIYELTEIDRAQLISVATFYSQFRHIPYGKHLIKVCTGTACHVKGAEMVFDSFKRELEMEQSSITTEDMLFSIEKIACLGCCTLAPVVQIDEKIYGHVLPGKVKDVISDFLNSDEDISNKNRIENTNPIAGEIRLGMGSCCQASGSSDIFKQLQKASLELAININIKTVGCVGVCSKVPLIDVVESNQKITRYPNVKAQEIKEILHHHFKSPNYLKRIKNNLLNKIDNFHTDTTWDNTIWKSENERTHTINSYLAGQKHISTQGFGYLTPLNINEYVDSKGFEALTQSITKLSSAEIIQNIIASGIRGRGGGGFSTGKKWEIVSSTISDQKYIICNGDEGDPGAFMDRMILESYPFRVIEGLIIAGYAIGANKGIFYIRAEYPLAVTRIRKALEICHEHNFLGNNILGSSFCFDIEIFEGAGAFVCGEETALIASIEGLRGFPKQRPPYPAIKGLFEKPTLVNNVETLSQIPFIIREGADYYNQIGTENSKGTKVFALAGKIRNGGLIEVPMGITINEIIENIGGGIEFDEKLKAVQVGGPSGGCIPAHLCDVKIDFDAFNEMGAMMGSGGLVVLSESDCMVDMARYFLTFTCEQSCGKCTFCRVGIKRMLEILNKICSGNANMSDLEKLEHLAINVKTASLCGLGKTAPNPVLTTLKYFREEYIEHINGKCKTGTCSNMIKLSITDECTGCTKCSKVCPVDAIPYTPYAIHTIDHTKCIKCNLCIDVCDYDAIIKISFF